MKLLRWLAGAELGDEIAGDLEEERRRRESASRAGAWLWRRRAGAGLIFFFVTHSIAAIARTAVNEVVRFGGAPRPELRRASRSLGHLGTQPP